MSESHEVSKGEAVFAMKHGFKVKHDTFTAKEWMTMEGGFIVFEDGCRCRPPQFWNDRTDKVWLTGWRILGKGE